MAHGGAQPAARGAGAVDAGDGNGPADVRPAVRNHRVPLGLAGARAAGLRGGERGVFPGLCVRQIRRHGRPLAHLGKHAAAARAGYVFSPPVLTARMPAHPVDSDAA